MKKEIEEDVGKYIYIGNAKDGTPRFKRPTGESFEDVAKILHKRNISYLHKEGSHLVHIYKEPNEKGYEFASRYTYYYTTGRWSGRGSSNGKYHSKGIKDFLDRYYRTVEEDAVYYEKREKQTW
tara:strand:+ start:90 stop:461 length:372 start_codon:yes stop_codon:yes gene_type:complete